MSDEQKIWFIYLTDHHEGPFTAPEIAEKAKAGLVTGASLAWKDGMPEWVAAESIPELAAAMGGGGGAELAAAEGGGLSLESGSVQAPAAAAGSVEGEVSLAQLLANSQKGDGTASGQIADSGSVLSSMASAVQASQPVTVGTKSGISIGGGAAPAAAVASAPTSSLASLAAVAPVSGAGEPGANEEVWTLKIGSQVSGLHTINRLKELAAAGEIPNDAMVWHPGWNDFQSVSAIPQLEAARKGKAGGGTKLTTRTGITRPGVALSAVSNAADDEPTDTGIHAPAPAGIKGIVFKLRQLVEKLKKKKKAAPREVTKESAAPAKGGKAAVGAKKGMAGASKRVAALVGAVLAVAGIAGGVYFYLFSSPIPSSVDVSDEDREAMVEAVKAKEGHRLVLTQARGTEDNPADPAAPKYFVASNLPEGAQVTLTVTGVPGTLVNRLSFEKSYTASVEKGHVAVFDKVNDDGKPLAWGDYRLKVTADGADPLDAGKKFIGMKGGAYQKRLKTYTDSVQSDYDKETAELREYITTLKNLQVEASKQIADFKKDWATPANRAKILADWGTYTKNSAALLQQLDTSLKARQAPDKAPKFHGRAFQDVGTTVSQLGQLVKTHGERLQGATPSGNPDELEGLVQAGVQALEAWLAQAVSKTPFAGHTPDAAAAKLPAASAAPVAPAPTTPAAPATPPPAASAPLPAAPAAPAPAPAPAANGGAL